jgi:membrane-associated protease RseP (regulator of RpoE activity)
MAHFIEILGAHGPRRFVQNTPRPDPLPQGERGSNSPLAALISIRALAFCVALAASPTLVRAADKGAPAPAPAPAPPAEKKAAALVPFEMLASNHMVVEAKVNGKGPFRLVFDLGAPITLLSNKAAEAAGVVAKDAPRSFLFSMRGEQQVKTLEVGELTAKGLPVIVLDHPALTALAGAFRRPLDGIIGFTFFARYRTTIDYQASRMSFEPVDFQVRNLMKDLPERLIGPKEAKRRVLAPGGLFGLCVAEPAEDFASAGVKVVTVLPGSPAETAGIKPGDELTALDGRWTASIADTYAAAAAATPGRAVKAEILREGKMLTVEVVPADGI